jgi:hypothetical protein
MLRPLIVLAFATSVAACVADPASSTRVAVRGGSAADATPTITFAADFTQAASGPLVAGGSATVHYDLARVTICEAQSNNMAVWGETGFALFDDGTQTSFPVTLLESGSAVGVDATIALPASASSVQLWFETTNEWGCVAYDSNYGQNYTFALDRAGLGATLDFGADWTFTQTAPVHAGDQVIIHYDPDRLNQCYALSNEQPAWSITAYWQVDGGTVNQVVADVPDGADLAPADPVMSVPSGHDLALWFDATSVYGCSAWDSAYGQNYHVAIVAP